MNHQVFCFVALLLTCTSPFVGMMPAPIAVQEASSGDGARKKSSASVLSAEERKAIGTYRLSFGGIFEGDGEGVARIFEKGGRLAISGSFSVAVQIRADAQIVASGSQYQFRGSIQGFVEGERPPKRVPGGFYIKPFGPVYPHVLTSGTHPSGKIKGSFFVSARQSSEVIRREPQRREYDEETTQEAHITIYPETGSILIGPRGRVFTLGGGFWMKK